MILKNIDLNFLSKFRTTTVYKLVHCILNDHEIDK